MLHNRVDLFTTSFCIINVNWYFLPGAFASGDTGHHAEHPDAEGGIIEKLPDMSATWFSKKNGSLSRIQANSISRNVAQALILGDFESEYKEPPKLRNITEGSGSMTFIRYNRTYYFGERYFNSSPEYRDKSLQICGYHIDANDEVFRFQYQDNEQYVREIFYTCQEKTQNCCDGLDCCTDEIVPWWGIVIILVLILIIATGLMFAAGNYQRKRKPTDVEKLGEMEEDDVYDINVKSRAQTPKLANASANVQAFDLRVKPGS